MRDLKIMNTNLSISSGAITDRGLSEKRPENQDSYLELKHCGIYAVADGVGGAQAGEVASQMAVEILAEAFNNMPPGADAEVVMRSAIEKANSAINQMAQDIPQLSSMATTIVALHLKDNIATIGHVGDSRLYRVDRNGNFYRETDDHSMVAEEVRAGRMTEEQAENHPSRNIISRALGAEPTVAVDLKTIMIDGGTAFLICSDGITRHVTDQEIKGVLTFGGAPSDICEYLKDLCYHRGAEDNLTAVVIKTASAHTSDTHEIETTHPAPSTDIDEPTVGAVRPLAAAVDSSDPDDEDLLELDGGIGQILGEPRDISGTDQEFTEAFVRSEPEQAVSTSPTPEFTIEPPGPPPKESDYQSSESAESAMFGDPGAEETEGERRSAFGVLSALGLVLLGAILGIGAYYFAMAPQPVDTDGPRLSEMRAANIPLSAFEENRRSVDKDPANYIARFGSDPQDSEDHYLLGRAYLLTGDYASAKLALTEARNRLPQADPTNAAVLASDIAIAMVVTNATTVQTMLRNELGATKSTSVQPSANTSSVP